MSKLLIVYETRHGSVRTAASELISGLCECHYDLVNLQACEVSPDPSEYDMIIIGGSIHFGRIQRGVRKYCRQNSAVLRKKPLGLFVCCMECGKKAWVQFESAWPKELIIHADVCGCFGGEFIPKKMNFLEKLLSGITEPVSLLNHEKIEQFTTSVNRILASENKYKFASVSATHTAARR